MKFWGIDYGSKLAGTTVMAAWQDGNITLAASQKKQDADSMILKMAKAEQPNFIFLDAPLSLPLVYQGVEGYSDYFYRKADKEVKGMSPMFLGGLTARAMKLQAQLSNLNIPVYETYPALHARQFDLKSLNYKKQVQYIGGVTRFLKEQLPFDFDKKLVKSWHHVDALLALYGAFRFYKNEHKMIGDTREGIIYY